MFHVFLQFLDEFLSCLVFPFFSKDDGGFHYLAPDWVGHSGDGAFHHGRVGHQRAFHLERTDAVAAAFDYVVGSSHEPVVAVLIEIGEVAREVVIIVPNLVGQFLVALILPEQAYLAPFVGT